MDDLEIQKYTDRELVKASLSDSGCYEALVKKYQQPIFRYIRRLGLDEEDAQDIMQEVFLKAYVNLNGFDMDLKFSSWLYRIAHNETISFFRKSNIRPKAASSEEELAFMDLATNGENLEELTDKKLLSERLGKIIIRLDVKFREPLILKYLEDKSYEEISDILKIPVGTVGTLINRGKKKFKTLLSAKL